MAIISSNFYYSICRFKAAVCSQCGISLRGKPTLSKRMSKRVNKKHTKYYCLPCALRLHVLTPDEVRTHGIRIPEAAP